MKRGERILTDFKDKSQEAKLCQAQNLRNVKGLKAQVPLKAAGKEWN